MRMSNYLCVQELAHDLDGDLRGHFRDCTILLTEDPIYLMAKSLYYAMKGVGTNENTIIEIIVGCTNEEINRLKQSYVYGECNGLALALPP